MNTTALTLFQGGSLSALGIGAYLGTGRRSITALIPTFIGAPTLLSVLAKRSGLSAAVVLNIVGLLGSAPGLVKLARWFQGDAELARPAAVATQSAMALLCGFFLAACARRMA